MKKITKCALSTLMAIGAVGGGITDIAAAVTKRGTWAYRAEPFQINEIYPNRNEIAVHYYGIGDDTKTNYLNVYWSDFAKVSEEEMDLNMSSVGVATPGYANLFTNKKTELSPNTVSTWRLWKYENLGSVELKDIPGVLYYSVRLANGTFLTGKADYRDCLNNPLYIEAGEGAYCKLEQYEEGGDLYYWPYEWSTGRLGSDEEPAKPIEKEPDDGIEEGADDGVEEGNDEDTSGDEGDEPANIGDDKDEDKDEIGGDDDNGADVDAEDSNNPLEERNEVEVVVPKTPNTGFGPKNQ